MESKLEAGADKESSGILQTFWGLSSLDESEQLQSAKKLITSLKESQESSDDAVCSDLEYCVRRLVRGLASNRKGARQGYFIALTEVLVMFPAIPPSHIFELMHTHLEPTGSDKAAEERGMYFGKLFALLSLIKSGRVTDEEDIVNVAKQLHFCSQRKTYLREFCYVSLGHLVDMCHAQGGDDVIRDHVIPLVLDTGWEGCTPEQLYLYLHLSSIYAKEKWFKQFLNKKLGSKHVINQSSVAKLGHILVESSSSHPRLHCVWALVLDAVKVKGQFEAFWKCVVDDSLFSSSYERKYLGFKLVETLLSTLTASEVPVTLSPNLFSCLLNNSSAKDNYLHLAAKHLLSELSGLISSSTNKELLIAIYLHLQRYTNNNFDRLTGSTLTDELLSRLSVNGVEQLLDQLMVVFCDPTTVSSRIFDDEAADSHSVQLWVLDQILILLRHRKLPKQSSWLLKATKNLLLFSLFKIPTTTIKTLPQELANCLPKAPLSASIQQALSQRFSSAISDLSSVVISKVPSKQRSGEAGDSVRESGEETGLPDKSRRWSGGVPGTMEDGRYFLTTLLQYTVEVLNGDSLTLLEEFTEEVSEVWDTVSQSVSLLSSKESLSPEERSFLLLFSAIGLQLVCSVEERGSMTKIAQEVSICFSEMSQALTKKKARTPKKLKEGPGWMAVLTDVLLGFLSQSSQLWRNVIEQVFKQLTHCVTEDSLKLILEVLEPKQSKDDLMEVDGEASDSGEDDDSSEGSEAGESGEEAEASSDSGDDSSVSGNPGENGEVDPVFRADVRKALGAAAMDSDAEGSESSFDDEAMLAVDDALAEVFRTRFALKHQKKIKQDEDKSVVHFKLRVLGLVEMFVRKESTNPLVLDVVVPLYKVIHASQSRKDHALLMEKATGIFKAKLCHMKDYPKLNIDVPRIHDYLHQFVDHVGKANAITAPLLTQGFLLLVRVLRGNTAPPPISPVTTRSGRKRKHTQVQLESNKHGLLDVTLVTSWLRDALHEFVTKKSSNINPIFFSTYIERYPSLGVHLVPKLIECLPGAANNYRKTQVYEMLATLRAHTDEAVGGSPFDQLNSEDIEAMDSLTTKSKKRKRSKHKK